MIDDERKLLQRLSRSAICGAALNYREKIMADSLSQSGLAYFDVALCITDAGRRAIGLRAGQSNSVKPGGHNARGR